MDRLVCGGFNLDLPIDGGIQITKEIAEVREPGSRNSDWTKTFVLPGSKTNKKAFTFLFDLDYSIQNSTTTNFSPDFNPNLKAPAQLYVDEVLQISGFIRLNRINVVDNESIEFECTLHGALADVFTNIADKLLSELDFSEFNHTLTTARVTESWDTRIQKNGSNYDNFDVSGDPTGEGYLYCLIDDGSYVNYYGDTNASQFYPALYEKQIVDKILEGAGYTYTDDSFFHEVDFRRKIVPCPTGMQLGEADIDQRLFEAEVSAPSSMPIFVEFDQENFDTDSQYDPTTFQFTSNYGGRFDFFFYCTGSFTGLTPSTDYIATFRLFKNGLPAVAGDVTFTTNGGGTGSMNQTVVYSNINVSVGDTIDIRFYQVRPVGGSPVLFAFPTINAGAKFYNGVVVTTWGVNNPVDFDAFFNDNTKQADFLKSVFIEYHLYVEPDPDNPTQLFIQTRDQFFRSTVRDWTKKRDLSQPLEIIPMGELDANPYYFKHADGEDDANKDYQAAYNRVYGDKKYLIQNDFIKNEKKIELIFAPSQVKKDPGYDKVLTYIPLNMDNGTGQLRSLYYGGAITCNPYSIYDSASMTGTATARTDYPFTAHIDSPTAPTLDLNFGMPALIGIPSGITYTNNNLFNRYWRRYIDEITDKDSKIVAGWFQLTPADMELFSFRDLYYFDRNYFRINKIEDYDPLNPGVFRCEFLFLSTAPDFVPSTGETGGGGSDEFGDFFPGGGDRRMPDGSQFNRPGLTLGRDHGTNGFQQLFVGDRIVSAPGARVNTVLGSDTIYVGQAEKVTVIGSDNLDVSDAASGDFWVHQKEVDMRAPISGQALMYNGTKWVPQTPGAASFSVITYNIDSSDSPYTIAEAGGFVNVFADTSGGSITVNLPTMSSFTGVINIKKTAAGNTLTIEPAGAETIDGAANLAVTTNNASTQIVSDGTNAQII